MEPGSVPAVQPGMWWLFPLAMAEDPCARAPVASGFDFPVGPPDARGYYDAQPFGRNQHLGSDWNGNGFGNTDFGDPVFAVAAGIVTEASDLGGGWGRVVRVAHRVDGACVESLYAHLATISLPPGALVTRERGHLAIATGADLLPGLHAAHDLRAGMPATEWIAGLETAIGLR